MISSRELRFLLKNDQITLDTTACKNLFLSLESCCPSQTHDQCQGICFAHSLRHLGCALLEAILKLELACHQYGGQQIVHAHPHARLVAVVPTLLLCDPKYSMQGKRCEVWIYKGAMRMVGGCVINWCYFATESSIRPFAPVAGATVLKHHQKVSSHRTLTRVFVFYFGLFVRLILLHDLAVFLCWGLLLPLSFRSGRRGAW